MKKRILWGAWILLYGICAGLAHIPQREGNQLWAIPALAALFFVPGALLLFDALRRNDGQLLRALRWISGLSVGLTVVTLIANVLSALGGETLGWVLHEILIFVSVPMLCLGKWYLSMFLWCCIFFATLKKPAK
jgi:hypothetical protein